MLCEITEQKKREVEDRSMLEDDRRNLANRLEEKSSEFAKISCVMWCCMFTFYCYLNVYMHAC